MISRLFLADCCFSFSALLLTVVFLAESRQCERAERETEIAKRNIEIARNHEQINHDQQQPCKPAEIEDLLREVGRAVAAGAPPGQDKDLDGRVQTAIKVLEAIGGAAAAEQQDDKIVIQANGCPLAAAVTVHPEVCQLAETLVAEIVKVPVHERCDRVGRPKCRFEISHKEAQKSS